MFGSSKLLLLKSNTQKQMYHVNGPKMRTISHFQRDLIKRTEIVKSEHWLNVYSDEQSPHGKI